MTKNRSDDDPGAGDARERWSEQRLILARALLDEGLSLDRLTALLDEKGVDLLDNGLPYVLVAARNKLRSEERRERRRVELESTAAGRDARSVLDPADEAIGRLELSATVTALAGLEPRESWPLWWHVAEVSDGEIALRCLDLGFDAKLASVETIKKRRQRLREQLRVVVGRQSTRGG